MNCTLINKYIYLMHDDLWYSRIGNHYIIHVYIIHISDIGIWYLFYSLNVISLYVCILPYCALCVLTYYLYNMHLSKTF